MAMSWCIPRMVTLHSVQLAGAAARAVFNWAEVIDQIKFEPKSTSCSTELNASPELFAVAKLIKKWPLDSSLTGWGVAPEGVDAPGLYAQIMFPLRSVTNA